MASKKTFLTFLVLFILIYPDASLGVQQGLVLVSPQMKRQSCPDGEYEHEGRDCCLCSAGQFLKNHCTSTKNSSCVHCERGVTYNPHPNSQPTCLSCTSCSQPNANLEEAEPCTIARDRVCRCKKDYYCTTNTGVCKVCHPCNTCDADGIQEACTATSDAVCNGAQNSGGVVAAAVLVPLFLLAALGGFLLWFRRRKAARRNKERAKGKEADGNGVSVEMEPLDVPTVDLQPYLPDIAEELGWNVVEHLAMRSGIKEGVIGSCKLDHHGDSQAQTLQLLKIWAEKHGRDSSKKLLQSLQDAGKKATAESVQHILSGSSSAT